MLTTAAKGISAERPVGGTPGNLGKRSARSSNCCGVRSLQPVNLLLMGELEDELVYHAVNTDRPADELELGVC